MYPALKMRRACIGAAITLVACAPAVATKHDANPDLGGEIAGWRTYAWLPPAQIGDSRLDNDIVRARIQNAVDLGLIERGYRLDPQHPDFMVGWHGAIEEKVNYNNSGYYGYGYADYAPYTYNQGSLVLDFVDTSRNELAWRGLAEGRLSSKDLAIPSAGQVKDAVAEILKAFPSRGLMCAGTCP